MGMVKALLLMAAVVTLPLPDGLIYRIGPVLSEDAPITILPPVGYTIQRAASFVLTIPGEFACFKYDKAQNYVLVDCGDGEPNDNE